MGMEKLEKHGAGIPRLQPCKGKTESLMAGLNCGMPSYLAWPVIRDLTDHFIAVGNDYASKSVYRAHLDGIVAGESGAAGIAGMLAAPQLFDENSVVLVVNTEADTDPSLYASIIEKETRTAK